MANPGLFRLRYAEIFYHTKGKFNKTKRSWVFLSFSWMCQNILEVSETQFAPNFGMTYKTIQCVFLPNLKSLGPTKTELQSREAGYDMSENGLVGIALAINMIRCSINVWRRSKLWIALTLVFIIISTWNLQRPFKTRLFTLCKNVIKKVVVTSNFWWRHCKPRIVLWLVK